MPHYQPTWVYYPPTYTQPWSPNYYPWITVTSGTDQTITFDSTSHENTTRPIG